MSEADKVWQATPDDDSRKRMMRTVWPALAEAFDGAVQQAKPRPNCGYCGSPRALGYAMGKPICGYCAGRRDLSSAPITVERVDEWWGKKP